MGRAGRAAGAAVLSAGVAASQRCFLLSLALVSATVCSHFDKVSWAVQAEFQEYSVLEIRFPSSSVPLCPRVVSLGLGLQNGKKMGDPVEFS